MFLLNSNYYLLIKYFLVYCCLPFFISGIVVAEESECALSSFYLEQRSDASGGGIKNDYSCFVDLQAIKLNEFVVIDPRDSHLFLQGSFRSAKNFAYDEISTKSFLNNKEILLIDRGFSKIAQGQQCAKLRNKNVNAYILNDGLRGLKENTEYASQIDINLFELVQVSSEEVISELTRDDLLIVVVDRESQKQLNQYAYFGSVFVDFNEGEAVFWKEVAKLKKELSSVSVLFFASQETKQKLVKSLGNGLNKSYFVYSGEAAEFTRFLENNKKYNENRNKTPNRYLCKGGGPS